jgi:triacylglycerol lipase
MYYPPNFDSKKAMELGNLVVEAYRQFEFYTNPEAYVKKYGKAWKLPADYKLVTTIIYNRWQLGFAAEDATPTLVDEEIAEVEHEEAAVSFGVIEDLFKDYPMGFVATSKDGKSAYLIFRGTVTKQEFLKDAKIELKPYISANWGYVALGFLEVYQACRESFIKTVKDLDENMDFYISGHSLGGALSVLSLPDVVKATKFKSPTLYNFGCPRVGDNTFVTAYNALPALKAFRVVNSSDLVPTLPPPAPIYYSHVNTSVEFNVQKNDIGLNHSMDTYLAALGT